MLDLAILGLLEERDLHGYEIRRQLREHLGLLANVSFGSIYPALTRLEKSGAVVATEGGDAERPAGLAPTAPPTGSLSGELAVLRARRHSPARVGGAARSTASPRRDGSSSASSWRAAARPTTPAASGSGWPSPGTSRPRPA